MSGANLAAIGDGSNGNWEIFQFQTAELIGPKTYCLSDRLRGQAGSDGLMPDVWPAGSEFVLLNSVPLQIDLACKIREVEQNYRIGPAAKSVDDPSYRQLERAFDGNGLRPYAPAHLRAEQAGNGDLAITWIRRTRIDGDGWEAIDVPLGEESEAYVLRLCADGVVVREEVLSSPNYFYTFEDRVSDGAFGALVVEVAQVSATYGTGLFQQIDVAAL